MTDSTRAEAIRRLQIIEGHTRAVRRMIEEGACCPDIIRQIDAVRSALGKVGRVVLEDHLQHCVSEAVRGEDLQTRQRMLAEIAALFDYTGAGSGSN